MGVKILIVDDEPSLLSAMKEYFEFKGYQVDCAPDREAAESCLGSRSYEVVVADVRLSGTDGAEGLEVLRTVRARHDDTKVVLLTAFGTPELERESRSQGADAFLHKPMPLRRLAGIVAELTTPNVSSESRKVAGVATL